jgi:hypothetical protein
VQEVGVLCMKLNRAGLQPRHVRAPERHPRAQRQRVGILSVAGPDAAVFERNGPYRQCTLTANARRAHVNRLLGLVHIDLPTPIRSLVALRYRRHLLCRVLVLPPHRISWSAKHQHTSKYGRYCERNSADVNSGTTSRKKTRDQPPPSHRIPPNARTASSTPSAQAAYQRRNPAARTADRVMR